MEVCSLASKELFVLSNDISDEIEIEVYDDTDSIENVLDGILSKLTEGNIFKSSTRREIKKIIKNNWFTVDLMRSVRNLESANDHSWDNAIFNGAL